MPTPTLLGNTSTDATISNTTAETTLLGTVVGTFVIGANSMFVGRTYRVRVFGTIDTTGTPDLAINVKFGTTNLHTASNIALVTINGVQQFTIDFLITCRSTGVAGTVIAGGLITYNDTIATGNLVRLRNTTTIVVDTTAAQTVNVTGTWGTASASNVLVGQMATLEVLN